MADTYSGNDLSPKGGCTLPQSKGEELNHSEEAQIWSATHIERRQLRWLRVRMTLRSLPGEMFLRPGSRPKSHWKDYISQLAWERLGERLDELEEVARGWLLTLLWMDGSDITQFWSSNLRVSWKPLQCRRQTGKKLSLFRCAQIEQLIAKKVTTIMTGAAVNTHFGIFESTQLRYQSDELFLSAESCVLKTTSLFY